MASSSMPTSNNSLGALAVSCSASSKLSSLRSPGKLQSSSSAAARSLGFALVFPIIARTVFSMFALVSSSSSGNCRFRAWVSSPDNASMRHGSISAASRVKRRSSFLTSAASASIAARRNSGVISLVSPLTWGLASNGSSISVERPTADEAMATCKAG